MRRLISAILIVPIVALLCYAPNPSQSQAAGYVLRLQAKVKIGDQTKFLSRKRFYLIKGSTEQNRATIETIERSPVVSRECYFRNTGASSGLIKWLTDNDND